MWQIDINVTIYNVKYQWRIHGGGGGGAAPGARAPPPPHLIYSRDVARYSFFNNLSVLLCFQAHTDSGAIGSAMSTVALNHAVKSVILI